ncbi:TPR-like protein [Rhodotorula sp. JG-1b]|nr:TPR-like protein [Rhodotorula sp. JG-1b]
MSTLLTDVESALLRLATPPAGASELVKHACEANPIPVLTSDTAKRWLAVETRTDGKLVAAGIKAQEATEATVEEDLLAIAVAALHAYAQVNWTGPSLDLSLASLLSDANVTDADLNDYAIDQLALGGEPVYHLSKHTFFLLIALQILGLVPSPFSSTPIWRLRAGIVWIKVLDEPVPLPPFVTADAASLRLSLDSHSPDRAALTLSLSLLATLLSRRSPHSAAQKEATVLAQQAANEANLEWELTGRLGKRTKFQVDEKTQLVVLARDTGSRSSETKAEDETPAAPKIPEALALNDDTLLERTAFTEKADKKEDDSKIVGTADLSSLDPAAQPSISSFSQAVLLSLALATLPAPTALMNLSADVLSTSQIQAFVARVLDDPQNWSVHSMALLLRCRAEAGRSRTVERGVLQMQALVDQLKDGSPTEISAISSAVKPEDVASARDRLVQFHALALPPAWEMERELAIRYMSLGVIKSALDIFTRLELWEEVARCWMTLERPDRGVQVIRELLEGSKAESDVVMNERKGVGARTFKGGEKREAKLWCTLGELENKPEHYEKAWEVSGHSSSRAMRSLGAVYWAKNDYPAARTALRSALAINPLFPRTWFMLGCCEMRLEDWAGAQDAFGRCVGLDDEDAESWSNLASCHLRRGEIEGDHSSRDARVRLPFSRKRAAFQCLRQAVKYSFDSWRMWYNYMVVAMDVGELSEACRALARMVRMRIEKDGEAAIDIEVLNKLVDAVTRGHESDEQEQEQGAVNPNVGKGLYRVVDRLITDGILPHVSSSPDVFLAHARLSLWSGDYAAALDSHLKAYRAAVANDEAVERDLAKFREACDRVETVVTMLENLGTKDGKDGQPVAKDWKFQARSLVRTFLGRTKEAFADEPEYERLKETLAELR